MRHKLIYGHALSEGKSLKINATATYDKKHPESIELIRYIKELKTKSDIELYTKIRDSEVFKIYIKGIENIISETKKDHRIPVLIFPPTKPNIKNQMKELLFKVNTQELDVPHIELVSEDSFELKNISNMDQREIFLKDNYSKWFSCKSKDFDIDQKNYFIFVDDVVLNGIMAKYCLKSLVEDGIDLEKICRVYALSHACEISNGNVREFKTETDILIK